MDQLSATWDSVPATAVNEQSGLQKVTGKISQSISSFAKMVDKEASKIGDDPNGPLGAIAPDIKRYGHMTAEAMERSADYVRDFDIDEVKEKTKVEIQRNPGTAILVAGAAGFILGALLKRKGL
jgi:ElaB/YqjD/DUF883 family membrane-anchored ribosome-binding protein